MKPAQTVQIVLLLLVGFVVASTSSLAYIDPGTGASVIRSLGPLIAAFFSAAGAFLIKYFWTPIKKFLSTGVNPGKYGIFDFLTRDPKTYLPKLNLTSEKLGLIKNEYVSAMKGKRWIPGLAQRMCFLPF